MQVTNEAIVENLSLIGLVSQDNVYSGTGFSETEQGMAQTRRQ